MKNTSLNTMCDTITRSIHSWESLMHTILHTQSNTSNSWSIEYIPNADTDKSSEDFAEIITKTITPIIEGTAVTHTMAQYGHNDKFENVEEAILYHTIELYNVVKTVLHPRVPEIRVNVKPLVWDAIVAYDKVCEEPQKAYWRTLEICKEFGIGGDRELLGWFDLPNRSW